MVKKVIKFIFIKGRRIPITSKKTRGFERSVRKSLAKNRRDLKSVKINKKFIRIKKEKSFSDFGFDPATFRLNRTMKKNNNTSVGKMNRVSELILKIAKRKKILGD